MGTPDLASLSLSLSLSRARARSEMHTHGQAAVIDILEIRENKARILRELEQVS
jgi:hypothetical protein